MIQPITIEFNTSPATGALSKLAKAALDRPDLVKAIAELKDPLFESTAGDERFAADDPGKVLITVYPSRTLQAFIRSIDIADGKRPPC